MANGNRLSMSYGRRFMAIALGALGLFVVSYGIGFGNPGIMAVGLAIGVLGPALLILTAVRSAGRQYIFGTAHVYSASPPPSSGMVGRCELHLSVFATGIDGVAVRVLDPAVPVSKWPDDGATLPVEVVANNPRKVRVLWDKVVTHAQAAGEDLYPQFGDDLPTDLDEDFDDDLPDDEYLDEPDLPPVPVGPPPASPPNMPTGPETTADGGVIAGTSTDFAPAPAPIVVPPTPAPAPGAPKTRRVVAAVPPEAEPGPPLAGPPSGGLLGQDVRAERDRRNRAFVSESYDPDDDEDPEYWRDGDPDAESGPGAEDRPAGTRPSATTDATANSATTATAKTGTATTGTATTGTATTGTATTGTATTGSDTADGPTGTSATGTGAAGGATADSSAAGHPNSDRPTSGRSTASHAEPARASAEPDDAEDSDTSTEPPATAADEPPRDRFRPLWATGAPAPGSASDDRDRPRWVGRQDPVDRLDPDTDGEPDNPDEADDDRPRGSSLPGGAGWGSRRGGPDDPGPDPGTPLAADAGGPPMSLPLPRRRPSPHLRRPSPRQRKASESEAGEPRASGGINPVYVAETPSEPPPDWPLSPNPGTHPGAQPGTHQVTQPAAVTPIRPESRPEPDYTEVVSGTVEAGSNGYGEVLTGSIVDDHAYSDRSETDRMTFDRTSFRALEIDIPDTGSNGHRPTRDAAKPTARTRPADSARERQDDSADEAGEDDPFNVVPLRVDRDRGAPATNGSASPENVNDGPEPDADSDPDGDPDLSGDAFLAAPSATLSNLGASGVSVSLPVRDLGRSVAFYRDVLGLPEVEVGKTSALLARGDSRVRLTRAAGPAQVDKRVVHLTLEVPDVHTAYRDLQDKGVEFAHPPRVVSHGEQLELWAATFQDPDGHTLALTHWEIRR